MSLGSASNFFLGAASATGGSGYEIQRSLRFNSSDASYLDRTPSSASNRKTFTFSCWVKASNPGLERIIFQTGNSWFRFNTNDAIYYYWSASDAIYTDAVLRDTSAWYHLILAVDTTDATASNRIKIYKNGVQQSVSGTQPSQDADLDFNNNVIHYIGRQGSNTANMFNGYLAETHFVDGQQLAATDFGEYDSNNVWQPKAFAGTYGPLVDQSQDWSSNITGGSGAYGAAANAFNGSLSNYASPEYSSPMTYTNPSASDTVISTFEIYGRQYSSSITLELNDTDISSQITSTVQWHTITGFSGANFEKLYWRPTSGNLEIRIYAVRINGKILVDDDVTVQDNSFYLKFADNSSNAALGTDSSGNNSNDVHSQ